MRLPIAALVGLVILLAITALILRPKPVFESAEKLASDCLLGHRKCEPGSVEVWGLDRDGVKRTSPLERRGLYDKYRAARTQSCVGIELDFVKVIVRSKNHQRLFFNCDAGDINYSVSVDVKSIWINNASKEKYTAAILPSYSTHWTWCEAGRCPSSIEDRFSLDPGG